MFRLDGKAALVTGASGGIGAAIARALHAQGAIVALSGTRRDALEALAGRTGRAGACLPGRPARRRRRRTRWSRRRRRPPGRCTSWSTTPA